MEYEKPRPKTDLIEKAPTPQEQRQMYAKEHSHKVMDSSKPARDEDSAETTANTNKWARTKDVEIGEIEAVQTDV